MSLERIIGRVSKALWETEDGKIALHKYEKMQETEGWAVHQGLLADIANAFVAEMLSKDFTNLSREEKDSQQKAMYYTKQLIDFLHDPLRRVRKLKGWEQPNNLG